MRGNRTFIDSVALYPQITDMVNEKQDECEGLESKIAALDKDIEWKKEVSSCLFYLWYIEVILLSY